MLDRELKDVEKLLPPPNTQEPHDFLVKSVF